MRDLHSWMTCASLRLNEEDAVENKILMYNCPSVPPLGQRAQSNALPWKQLNHKTQ